MKNDEATIDDVPIATLDKLIAGYIAAGGALTTELLILQMRIDGMRGEFYSMAHYAAQFKVSIWRIRTIAADGKVPHEFRTKKRDSSEISQKTRTDSAQARTKNGEIKENSKKLHTTPSAGRRNFADSMKKTHNSGAPKQQQQLGGEYGPTLRDVLLECAANGFPETLGKKFHQHYATRYWKLKDGTRLPEWNWRMQLRIWLQRESLTTKSDNEEKQSAAGTSKSGNDAGNIPRNSARGKSNGAELSAKREALYRKRFGK